MSRALILDAMGVIYRSDDDVNQLLIPFVKQHHGIENAEAIEHAYTRASRGEISARDLWLELGVDPDLEDHYLAGHSLSEGLPEFLSQAQQAFDSIACLSNDLSEWSLKLRKRFGLERYISQWFISGDLHIRKPSPEVYKHIISSLHRAPSEMVFVDDRPANLRPARLLGIECVLFGPTWEGETDDFTLARSFQDILALS